MVKLTYHNKLEAGSCPAIFPSEEWLKGLEEKLNSDEHYAEIAKNWEGDLFSISNPKGI
jgi:hypothetical protein